MISKKDLIIVALATFCLTATLFMVLPTRSQPGGYDPWLDTNADGAINILESILTGNHFLTSGDPTKPVVMNAYNWSNNYYEIILGPGDEGSVNVTTAGYRQITIGFRASTTMPPLYGNVSIATGFLIGTANYVNVDRFNATPGWTGPELPILHEYPVVRTYDVRGQLLTIAYYNPNAESYILRIEYYITT